MNCTEYQIDNISSENTSTFNPLLYVKIYNYTSYGWTYDIYEKNLEDLIKNYIIINDLLIHKKNLPQLEKLDNCSYWFEREQANLYNLLNQQFIQEAPQIFWDWFNKILEASNQIVNQ